MKISFEKNFENFDAPLVMGIFNNQTFTTTSNIESYVQEKASAFDSLKDLTKEKSVHIITFKKNPLILIGLADPEIQNSPLKMRQIGGIISKAIRKVKGDRIIIDFSLCPEEAILEISFGVLLGAYEFSKYHTKASSSSEDKCKELVFIVKNPEKVQQAFIPLQLMAQSICWARDLVNEPGNKLDTTIYAEHIKSLEALGLEIEILDKKALEVKGAGGILSVGQGSDTPPYLVILKWNGGKNEQPLAFVGKGITFDSGGISLKPSANMEQMKGDMAGSAVVCGLMRLLAQRKANINAVGIVALAENMPSGSALRPGDVITSLSGQTIEVINTDAEGRLILADALWYAQEQFNPKYIVDIATLTGAMGIALGSEYAGLFSNDDTLAKQLEATNQHTGEKLWRLPLDKAFNKALNSDIADMKNITGPGVGAGSITAAQFLQRFVNKTPWAHIDIAAVDFVKSDTPLCPKGGNAFGIQCLNKWIEQYEK